MLQRSTKILAIVSILIFLVSVAALVGFYLFIEKGKEQYAAQELDRARAEKDEELFKSLSASLEATKEARVSLESRILKDDEVINLLALIEQVGREQGVTLSTDSLTVAPINGKFESLLMDVKVEGTYATVLRMVSLLEHIPYQTTIRAVQIMSDDGGVWKGTISLSVTKFKKP